METVAVGHWPWDAWVNPALSSFAWWWTHLEIQRNPCSWWPVNPPLQSPWWTQSSWVQQTFVPGNHLEEFDFAFREAVRLRREEIWSCQGHSQRTQPEICRVASRMGRCVVLGSVCLCERTNNVPLKKNASGQSDLGKLPLSQEGHRRFRLVEKKRDTSGVPRCDQWEKHCMEKYTNKGEKGK